MKNTDSGLFWSVQSMTIDPLTSTVPARPSQTLKVDGQKTHPTVYWDVDVHLLLTSDPVDVDDSNSDPPKST
ncbi:Hypothetical predicted protein [Xyrichtys novacula]|uniref:Uncharacterized protein n=1 Tax=Xyrichtys novacula TaxID=13765 RepID=A0AAV1GD45_XYRNO|nr:Hypothetical predicted protein [Xyrichtys novacula]